MARILITGSMGNIGHELQLELLRRGHDVYGCDLHHSHKQNYRRCDVGQYRQVLELFKQFGDFDLVYHAGAEFGRANGEDFFEQLWTSNMIGTKNMLRLQKEYGYKMVFFSSSEAYGDYGHVMYESVPLDHPLRQLNSYAISKSASELEVINDSERYSLKNVRVRLFNTYGREMYNEYRSVIARFCYYVLHSKPYTVHLGHKRSFSYIDDTVNALANIISAFVPGNVYNIGDSTQYSIKYISDLINKECGTDDSLVQYEDKEKLTTTEKAISNHKASMELGYHKSIPIEEGIRRTVAWMRKIYNK